MYETVVAVILIFFIALLLTVLLIKKEVFKPSSASFTTILKEVREYRRKMSRNTDCTVTVVDRTKFIKE